MNLPRNEYPRPQFERKEWINLNGEWSYSFDFSKSGDDKNWRQHGVFADRIIVPFCPESRMSGVGFTDFIEMMWYQRVIEIPSDWGGKSVLLHFGGVDYQSVIYIDGAEAGCHTGGNSPFTLDITRFVKPGQAHNLVVRVKDDVRSGLQAAGKQSQQLKSARCNYTRTTGIWQTVWMEAVDFCALKQVRIIPDYDNGAFTFIPVFYNCRSGLTLTVEISDGGNLVASRTVKAGMGSALTITLDDPREWNPETPFLYDISYTLRDSSGIVLDQVNSYAGLRKIHIENGRCYLNNQPIFLRFVLDQGYYEDSLLTAPNDAALRNDIELAMKAGFNGARLHQKVCDERFHYWADRLGYLTWGEFADWGIDFWHHNGKTNPGYNLAFRDYFAEWSAVVERDINHPSIITWTPFNETSSFYNLQDHRRMISDIYNLTRQLDPTRPVNDTSGYVHVKTDLWTVHNYSQNTEDLLKRLNEEPVYMNKREFEEEAWDNQPYIIDEYGGISFIPEGRKPFADNSWGYNRGEKLTQDAAEQRIISLTDAIVNHPRLAGYCYTQLTDIEQEQNGIYNYDRTEKFDMDLIRKCFLARPEWSRF